MRIALMVICAWLSGCATAKLAVAPPPGVDFSGKWRLNEAESDDPMRLASQSEPSRTPNALDPGQGQGGQGRGGRGGRGGGFGAGLGGSGGPAMPGVGVMGEGLRWPGKDLEIKQVSGVVSLSSGGLNEVYTPRSADGKPKRSHKPHAEGGGDADDLRNRDMPDHTRGQGPPAKCGWDDKTLVVQGGDPDDDHPPFEKRYALAENGQQLIEVVSFHGGRSSGYTLSRTWDRVVP
jgi:hypothetical protein